MFLTRTIDCYLFLNRNAAHASTGKTLGKYLLGNLLRTVFNQLIPDKQEIVDEKHSQ